MTLPRIVCQCINHNPFPRQFISTELPALTFTPDPASANAATTAGNATATATATATTTTSATTANTAGDAVSQNHDHS